MESLRTWFLNNRRDLPWRNDPTPYQVWVSEIMLQQTQVSVVIPYYNRWLETFPTIQTLASAPESQVIKLWEGLGYYSRARNLHKGAQYIVEHHQGKLPSDPQELLKIPGIGPYTQGAILSFAFHQKAPAIDGNVKRVLSRYQLSPEITHVDLPDHRPWEVMEGLIELGALVCTKQPTCDQCPLYSTCKARSQGRQLDFPPKKKRPKTTHLQRKVQVILADDHLLVRKIPPGQVMAGLYEFPYDPLSLNLEKVKELPEVTHTFTRYKAKLTPTLYRAERKKLPSHCWVSLQEIKTLPFSSGHKKVLCHALSSI